MIKRLKGVSKSSFVRNVVIVALGTAGAQAITLAFTPIITRLYAPESFGQLGTFMAILVVMSPIAALTYPIAIVLPKLNSDAVKVAKLSAVIAIVISAITAAILSIGDAWLAQVLGMQAIEALILLIPLAMLISAFQQIGTQYLIREKKYKITAQAAILQAFSVGSSKVILGFVHPVGAILITVAIAGQAFHSVLLWLGLRQTWKTRHDATSSSETVLNIASQYRDFPLYRAPQTVLNALSQSLPIIALATIFGPISAGLFALSKSVLAAPASLVGSSVGNVFYPKAVELEDTPDALQKLLFKSTLSLLIIGAFVFLPVLLFGPTLFSFIFGSEWEQAGGFGRFISLWMIASLAARPAISAIPILDLQKKFLLIEILFLPLKAFSIYFGTLFDSPIVAVGSFCLVSSIFYGGIYLLVARSVSEKVKALR